ncbi:MAG: tetratricopeptide repeat protein [Anaerolineaceae bacterium]|jgi:tetratricopeptide (TPR) repeat protein|nr:tetratricopeptide repeat protein [Anaerolineaceae bacterium]
MNKRRRRSNPWLIAFLLIAIGFVAYLNVYIIPTVPPPFVPTPTPTRDPVSYVQEAEVYVAEGRYTVAMEAYQAALKADPQNVSIYLSLAKLQIYSGEYEAASVNAENALLLDKTRSQSYGLLAWARAGMGEYLEAENFVKTGIDLDPNNAFLHAVYADVLARRVMADVAELDTLDLAIEESQKAITLGPDLLEAHWARAIVLEITGNYEEAIAQLERAIEINDKVADLHLLLGRNYFAIEENDQAIFEFTRAYALNPTDPTPNWYVSQVYLRLGEHSKAIQAAETAVNDAPSDPAMYGNLGTMYYRDLQYNRAIEALELAVRGGTTADGVVVEGLPLDYSSTVIGFYSRYGLSLARVNRCTEAVQIAQAILQTVADDETAVYNADIIIETCQENQVNPPTETPTPEEGDPAVTPTEDVQG